MYGNRHPVLERTVEGFSLICFLFLFTFSRSRREARHVTHARMHARHMQPSRVSRTQPLVRCRRAGSCSVGVRGRGWTRRVERLERDHDLRSLLAPQCAAAGQGAAPKLRTKSPGATTMNKTIGTVRDYLNFLWRLVRRTPAPRGPGLAERDTTRAPTAPCARVASRVPVRVGAWPRK